MECTRCGNIIPQGAGFYNIPSGILCQNCGGNRTKAITRGEIMLDNGSEILDLLQQLSRHQDGRINPKLVTKAKKLVRLFEI